MTSALGLGERLQGHVLSALGVGVIACRAELDVVWWSRSAVELLRSIGAESELRVGAPIPACLGAAFASWSAQSEAVTVAVHAGPAVICVWTARVPDVPPVDTLVFLRADTFEERELLDLLRRRYRLSVRDLQLIGELRSGYANRDIAQHLGLTENTVKSYLSRLFSAMGASSRTGLVAIVERTKRDGRER